MTEGIREMIDKVRVLNEELSLENIQLNDNFWRWFGESKVVDANGNPMICYHGTPKGGFAEFKPKVGYKGKSKQQADLGSHFSTDREFASIYTRNKKTSKMYETFLRIENPLNTNECFWKEDNEELFAKHLNFVTKNFKKFKLTRDFYRDKSGEKLYDDPQFIMVSLWLIDSIPSNKLYHGLIDSGFDGVIYNPYQMTGINTFRQYPLAYLVLEPNQIKSIENDGSWDITDNNIYS